MKPLIKEEPREWRKFMLQFCGLVLALAIVLGFRGTLLQTTVIAVAAMLVGVASVALARPRWFRSFYRGSMVVSAWLGERMSKVVLTLLFFVAFTPLGLILRLFRHDPLARRRWAAAKTYWQPVRRRARLDRMH